MEREIVSQDIPHFKDVKLVKSSATEINRITQICIS